jgi:hypothetical protein
LRALFKILDNDRQIDAPRKAQSRSPGRR